MVTHQIVKLTPRSKGCYLVTDEIMRGLRLPSEGILHLFLQHTSAALAIQENASPAVQRDLSRALDRLVPEDTLYEHSEEGPDDMPAHVKNVLCGSSVSIPFSQNGLLLGQWQGIYLLEFRSSIKARTLIASIYS